MFLLLGHESIFCHEPQNDGPTYSLLAGAKLFFLKKERDIEKEVS